MLGNLVATVAPSSSLSSLFPPSSTYDPSKDIPDLTGKVIIVTGGNSGIGYQTVKQLLLKNAKVYLAARSLNKAEDASRSLKEETGKEPVLLKLDLADLKSVRTAAEEFLSKEEELDVLFNNAGVMTPPLDMITAQGYDVQFGTNVLGHYFFTKLLLPALERSTAHHGTKARVINTSSSGNRIAPGPTGIEWTALKGGPDRDKTLKGWGAFRSKWSLYGASKIGNVFISNIFVRRHGDVIISCSLDPGWLRTDLQQHVPRFQKMFLGMVLHPAHYGAWTQLWAGTSPDGEKLSGKYLMPWARIGEADPRAKNEKTQDELEKWLDEQIQGF